jgi:hypothetical protein
MTMAPVVYIVFNRPRYTEISFEVIRTLQPKVLYIVADGPRPNYPVDIQRCEEVRTLVDKIDWPCEVHRNYAKTNMGLKARISTGLNWVFKHSERAIILEDDCIPHPDFFTFCNSLLDKYSEDERVSVITGCNFQNGIERGEASYYFSKYNHCWGWASWRRAWSKYQGDLGFWEGWRESSEWVNFLPDVIERTYWRDIFDRVAKGDINSWAYPWTASVWRYGGLTATPNVNLVSNIGIGIDATNTTSNKSSLANIKSHPLGSLIHPRDVKCNLDADRYVFDNTFLGRDLRLPWSAIKFPLKIISLLYGNIKKCL